MHGQQNKKTYEFSSHLTVNSQDLHCKNQSVNGAFGKSIMHYVCNEIRTAVLLIKILCGYADFSLFGAPSSEVKFVNVFGGMEVELHLFVTSALDGTDWSSLVTGERIFSTHRRRGWLGPRAGLETM